ncbi:hypothetical protein POM88_034412 [Heracleum sosnowskyi]|uniref:Uncharacterized protein n=1 Tax=Heracleum sosnowskyi TaxID=360622 RepID=A0AAD8HLI6_9APIA|nr:hypothetical protein POM88_034412 [Heracleum sosnowskyi]
MWYTLVIVHNRQDYVVCSAKFPQAWTEASSIPNALVCMLLKLPKVKFVIVTLGEDGCLMLERCLGAEGVQSEESDADSQYELMKQKRDTNKSIPTCISSNQLQLSAEGIGVMNGRFYLGTAEKIPPSELVDTTGDVFVGADLYDL